MFVKIGLLMALVMGLFGTYRMVSAQDEISRGNRVKIEAAAFRAPAASQTSNAPAAIKHILTGTIINTCGTSCPSMSMPAFGFTPVDAATTVTCPGTSGTCTFEADQDIEVSAVSSGIALCFAVDGAFVDGGCFFAAETPADGSAVQTHTTISLSGVLHGTTHTVQTYVDSGVSGVFNYYNVDYRIYKP
jgi:hypothetical protein